MHIGVLDRVFSLVAHCLQKRWRGQKCCGTNQVFHKELVLSVSVQMLFMQRLI